MMELFKGYIETKNKKAIEKFKNKKHFRTYEQVQELSEYAGILGQDVILVDVDDFEQSEILMDIVEDMQLGCRVYETTRGKHFLFKNTTVESCKTHTKVACGLEIDIKLGSRNSYSILKYKHKERPIIYDINEGEEYDSLPKWLLPIRTSVDFLSMEGGDGRNQALFNYILTLQSNDFTKEEARECIRIINTYVLVDPLSDNELDVVLRDDSFKRPTFFKGNSFLFDKFATFMKNNHYIIKINGQLHMYRDGVYLKGNEDIEAEMIKHIPTLARKKRSEVLSYLDILIRKDTPMADARYIAFKNGIYDIETDSFQGFTPSIVVTNKINHNYNEAAHSALVDKTLDSFACNDPSIRDLLEEAIGYCFYRRNELRKSFILIGDKANGKSTFLDMIKTLLGDGNTSSLDIKELGYRFKTAELFGKLANIGDDIGDEFIADAAVFRKVVSGESLTAEFKGTNAFQFKPFCKLLFSANDIPRIKDKTGAVIDRLIIIPFRASFTKEDPNFNPYIKYELRKNENMEYLIQLGLDGLSRVLENRGFTVSSKVQEELAEYETNNNPILHFFSELDVNTEIANQPTKEVYEKYVCFCLENNYQKMSNIEFSKQINKKLGFKTQLASIDGKKYRTFISKEVNEDGN